MSQDIRKNHHDFSNILLSLGGYIFQSPMNELELKNYYQQVSHVFEKDYQHFVELSKLKNLDIPELKALIFSKMTSAINQGIPFHLEIEETIHELPLDELTLVRICGILLDNALEAAAESVEPYVHFALISDKQTQIILIINSTGNRNLTSLTQQKNFSTKGNKRGLGLSIVKELLSHHKKGVSLKTTQVEGEVHQTLIFSKETNYGH